MPTATPFSSGPPPQTQLDTLTHHHLALLSPTLQALTTLKQHTWTNPTASAHFAAQRAATASTTDPSIFLRLMSTLFTELNTAVGVLTTPAPNKVLDLCMAPGGFTGAILDKLSDVVVDAVCLPEEDGGHAILLDREQMERVRVVWMDITTATAAEGGGGGVGLEVDRKGVFMDNNKYELVLCDGAALRSRGGVKEIEKIKLVHAQMWVSLQRIATGGTILMLCHDVSKWESVALLYHLNRCSKELRLWKSKRKFAVKDSFYAVAKGVRPDAEFIAWCRRGWELAMVDGTVQVEDGTVEEVEKVCLEFGSRLVEMAEEEKVWEIQRKALEGAEFNRKPNKTSRRTTQTKKDLMMQNWRR